MQISAGIFKAYDIRGVVPTHLNDAVALALGRAFGTLVLARGQSTVAVGRDGRLSAPALAAALVQGLVDVGVQVLDLGMVTTPMLYFATSTLCRCGIQVTGSHNPPAYNGFKLVLDGQALHGAAIQDLRRCIEDRRWVFRDDGTCRPHDVLAAYTERIVGDIRLRRPLHIVVDCGNGVAGASAPGILRAIGCEVTALHSAVDGNFPNHHPDPSKPENLRDLIAALQAGDAELGLAFDGDGDRLGLVTRTGEVIYPDRQLMLFARDVLERQPGSTIVFDCKCSQRLAPVIEAAGGVPLMYKTGHSLIKAKMREIGAPLGGEMSGHIFFQERWFGFDDATYAGCRLLEIVSAAADAGALLQTLPSSFSTPELSVACAEGDAHALVQQLVDGADFAAPARVSTTDGLRVDWPDGFGLVRASNTTPVLSLRFEGHTPAALQRIQGAMLAQLRRLKPDAQLQESVH